MLTLYLPFLCALLASVSCNTEKAIFTAPESVTLPNDASIDHLYLTSVNPQHPTVRTYLNASWPTRNESKGSQTWVLLEGLMPLQRYEIRVCWLATQPTSFWLHVHEFSKAMEDPNLISSLSTYAYARRDALNDVDLGQLQTRRHKVGTEAAETSLLLLQIYAAPDYFSLNQTLMDTVPPVLVDIILDRYILNIFPQSLVFSACYIAVIAVVAWFLSALISSSLRRILSVSTEHGAALSKKQE